MENKIYIPTFEEIIEMAPIRIKVLLELCKKTEQSPTWHPEGDVYIHTRIVYNRAREYGDMNLALAALFHDLGKVKTTKLNSKGGWSAYGHEFVSGKIVNEHRAWIGSTGAKFMRVKDIVENHMRIKYFDEMRKHKQNELKSLEVYDKLLQFTECDSMSTLKDSELI